MLVANLQVVECLMDFLLLTAVYFLIVCQPVSVKILIKLLLYLESLASDPFL